VAGVRRVEAVGSLRCSAFAGLLFLTRLIGAVEESLHRRLSEAPSALMRAVVGEISRA